jgi:WD40 repeat protein
MFAIAPDGKTLAVGCPDGTARLWNISTEQVVATVEGHPAFQAGRTPEAGSNCHHVSSALASSTAARSALSRLLVQGWSRPLFPRKASDR